MKLTRPEAVSGNVAFVKTEKLGLDHFNETFAIRCFDLLLRVSVDMTDRLWLAQFFANHGRDRLSDVLPVLQTEWIRVSQRLAHGGITSTGAFVGPYKHIAQQFNTIEFIDAQHGTDVGSLRNIDEGQWAQIPPNQGNVGGQAGNPLVDVLKVSVGMVLATNLPVAYSSNYDIKCT